MNKTISTFLLAMAMLPALAQEIGVVKETVDCGVSAYERPVTAVFELENKGNAPLVIKNVRTSCGCLGAEYPSENIEAGEKFTLKLTYDGRQLGRYVKSAGIYSNVSDKPFYLTMMGVVRSQVADYTGEYPYKMGNLRVNRRDIEFDDVNRGDNPVAEIFLVNEGTESMTPNLMHMPAYITAVATPEVLMPGKSGKIRLTLNSDRLRDYGLTQTSVYLANQLGDKTSEENEISISAVLLNDFSKMTDAVKQWAPRMTLSTEELNLEFGGKKKRSGKITIVNEGRTTLEILALQMFTKGLSVKLNKRIINPGEKATLKITATRNEIEKLRTKPRVLMITNDPERSKVVINVNTDIIKN